MRLPEATEIIAAAKTRIGGGRKASDADIAYELRSRYGLRPGQPAVNRWANGNGKPNFEATVALLEMAGWLSRGEAGEAVPQDRLEELAAGILALTEGQQTLVGEVRALRASSEAAPATGRARPKRKQTG